jgi:N-acetyl-gamma-glutamyl-phosphate reductase
MRIPVAIVGISGYSGLELLRIALAHPGIECAAVVASEAKSGQSVADIHPHLRSLTHLTCQPPDMRKLAAAGCRTVFLCTPNEVSHKLVPQILECGMKAIDLSGSYRLREASLYSSWYGFDHEAPALLREAVYGLPEWYADAVREARLVANPGCYPTSVLLALLPLVRAGALANDSDIVCDSKSGVTGAGRSLRTDLLFGEVSENFRAYSPIVHRHAPEICQELGWAFDSLTFVPHLIPVNRGILSTIYVRFDPPQTAAALDAAYRERYRDCPFIRLLGASRLPELSAVNHSNFCDIGWRLTAEGRKAVIFSAIDNLVKGAAGQAVQNFNLMHGFPGTLGLLERCDLESHAEIGR